MMAERKITTPDGNKTLSLPVSSQTEYLHPDMNHQVVIKFLQI
jgi:hypothetical protein